MSQLTKSLLLLVCVPIAPLAIAFQPSRGGHRGVHDRRGRRRRPFAVGTDVDATARNAPPASEETCYYKRADGSWKPRKELRHLSLGERLFASRLPARDLLDGKTGPKVFLECGVGSRSESGKWNMVNGMVRLGRRGAKKSVVKKKIQKMARAALIEVYVSNVSLAERRLEVCLTKEKALGEANKAPRISASGLKEGDELSGTVKRVTPYGAFVDVRANRMGLLHITKVARRHDAYIAQESGLKGVGLTPGAAVRVVVASNERKRLELDLAPPPPAVEEEGPADDDAADGGAEEAAVAAPAYEDISDEEALAWAAYAGSGTDDDEESLWASYRDDDDDEDADIEDALGIGSY